MAVKEMKMGPDGVKRQSTHQRCPKCKCVRARWFRANAYNGQAKWERIEEGKSKVCHICVARHRGLPLPGANLKAKKIKPPREQPPKQEYQRK